MLFNLLFILVLVGLVISKVNPISVGFSVLVKSFSYFLLIFLGLLLVLGPLLTSGLIFYWLLGISLVVLFSITYSVWSVSLLGLTVLGLHYWSTGLLSIVVVVFFETFISLLRPVTLLLRIFINISLGHTLIQLSHLVYPWFNVVLWLFETFVYFVQSFVFISLVVSYLNGP